MKRIISIILTCAIVIVLAFTFTACKKVTFTLETSWDVPDYETLGTVATGKSALAMFNEALENYYDADYVTFIRSMSFDAGFIATQQTIDISKFYNDKVFTQGNKQGTNLGNENDGNRFYYDGTNAYELKVRDADAKTRFPALGTEDWAGLEYSDYDATDKSVADKLESIRNFSLYVINQDTLSADHNDSVYSYNDKYYICITINCMDITLGTIQKDVEEDIFSGLGSTAVPGSFKWKGDTKLYMEITDVDGELLITARSLQESYSAKQSGLNVPCTQTISGTFSYAEADALITTEEKLNKA